MIGFASMIKLYFLISSIRLTIAGNEQPLVTFGELSEVILDRYSLRSVEAIEEDLLNPGGFIVGNQHSVAVIAPNMTVKILAGQENETAFNNGVGGQVYFSTVQHVTQYRDGADIIVADYGNHCIRIVNRATARVSTFAGQCTRAGDLEDQFEVGARRARLSYPIASLYVKQQNVFYYLLHKPSAAIVKHNLTSGKVSPVYRDVESFRFPFAMIIDSNNKNLYVNHVEGISRFDTETWERTVVAGTNGSSAITTKMMSRDGTLSTARFHYMAGMAWLIQDQVLLANQYGDHSLRVVNFVDNHVSTICKGQDSTTPRVTTGNLSTCNANQPLGITVVNGSIYIGEESGKLVGPNPRVGHIVKLTYHQPLCSPPNFNSTYNPLREVYTHNQMVQFGCDRGFGISSVYDSIQCVRDLQNNTVVGRWDHAPPLCQRASLVSVQPLQGQRAGGTKVTLIGAFPGDVKLQLVSSDNRTTRVLQADRMANQLVLSMPQSGPNDSDVTIRITFGDSDTDIDSRNYTYLSNPTITSVSRNRSIARGGLSVIFHGDYLTSSRNYELLFEDNLGTVIASVDCNLKEVMIECVTPNLEELFGDQARDEDADITLRTTLLSEGHSVNGARNSEFVIADSYPIFQTFSDLLTTPIQFNLEDDTNIVLNGTKLNRSLMANDYRVDLVLEGGMELRCLVTSISGAQLTCQPPVQQISILPSEFNVKALIKVTVGASEAETVGKVTFYQPCDLHSHSTQNENIDLVAVEQELIALEKRQAYIRRLLRQLIEQQQSNTPTTPGVNLKVT